MIRVLAIGSMTLLITIAAHVPVAHAMPYTPMTASPSTELHMIDDDDDDDDDRHFGRRYRGDDDGWPRYRNYSRDDDDDDDD